MINPHTAVEHYTFGERRRKRVNCFRATRWHEILEQINWQAHSGEKEIFRISLRKQPLACHKQKT